MTRGILLTAAALAMLAAPAFAQDRCSAPLAPTVPDGKTASIAQLSQSAKDVVAFIKASDDYQTCLLAAIAEQDKLAKDPKNPPDPAIKKGLETKGDANQKEKERVGGEYNKSAAAYKTAHPK
ncbi:MAG TPA: hypothetical protein VGM72_11735 [Micropepsaceae bacterium]|jgi:hypothetical protein